MIWHKHIGENTHTRQNESPPEVRRHGGRDSADFRFCLIVSPDEDERRNQSVPKEHIDRVNGDCKRPTLNGE